MATRLMVLEQEHRDLTVEGQGFLTAADAAGRGLTEVESARSDAIFARLAAIEPEIAQLKALKQLSLTVPALPDGGPRITGGRDLSLEKPWGYELGVRMIERLDGVRAFGGVKRAAETALGAAMQAIFRAGMGGPVDQRLLAGPSGGNTGDPAAGGFSVGTDLSAFLFGMGAESSMLLRYCQDVEIGPGSDGIEAPYITNASRATGSRFGGVRVYRRKEAATVSASYPEEEKFELRLADLMGIAYQTDRLLADAAAMGAIYATAFRNEFAFVIDDEIIRGTGVGECQGILNSPALVSVAKETSQAAASLVYNNLSKMWVRLPAASKAKAIWFVNGELGPQFDSLSIPVGVSALEPRIVNYGPDGVLRIKGRPVVELEQAAAPGTQSDIMLLDLSEYIVIRKGALEEAQSDHVRFLYNERTFRWVQRINGKCHWRTAVTPFKGSLTRSPLVTLDARA